ncbi:hypothetical protein SAMN04488021_12436 [Paracoccus aminovorans]|uniref:Uncharacterized protein n=1 Tax=Paracoccus aminovorans TaxID=34004 RepID=A0A1I3BTC1_9RHOB|nr:hypothetical protein JCM7685_1645 [Paracoccus aminovorans]SFH65189.1 hypothetical protein SAMN04488021_12436 [Paracoccus aminovorans]
MSTIPFIEVSFFNTAEGRIELQTCLMRHLRKLRCKRIPPNLLAPPDEAPDEADTPHLAAHRDQSRGRLARMASRWYRLGQPIAALEAELAESLNGKKAEAEAIRFTLPGFMNVDDPVLLAQLLRQDIGSRHDRFGQFVITGRCFRAAVRGGQTAQRLPERPVAAQQSRIALQAPKRREILFKRIAWPLGGNRGHTAFGKPGQHCRHCLFQRKAGGGGIVQRLAIDSAQPRQSMCDQAGIAPCIAEPFGIGLDRVQRLRVGQCLPDQKVTLGIAQMARLGRGTCRQRMFGQQPQPQSRHRHALPPWPRRSAPRPAARPGYARATRWRRPRLRSRQGSAGGIPSPSTRIGRAIMSR